MKADHLTPYTCPGCGRAVVAFTDTNSRTYRIHKVIQGAATHYEPHNGCIPGNPNTGRRYDDEN